MFSDDPFLVTDYLQQTLDNSATPNLNAGLEESLNIDDNAELNTSLNSEDNTLLLQLRPNPKSEARATGARSMRRKSSSTTVLTDTPAKKKNCSAPKASLRQANKLKKNIRKQLELVSSSGSKNEVDSDMPSLTDGEKYSS